MNKLAGFLTGAGLAGLAVFALGQWRAVTDDDRLIEAMKDHCLPYVVEDVAPFGTLGRAPGVYDAVTLEQRLSNGGARLIFDARFIAQWGEAEGAEVPTRTCFIAPTYAEDAIAGFAVEPEGFVDRYTEVFGAFGPLTPDAEDVAEGPSLISWRAPGAPFAQGLRVSLGVSPSLVSHVVIAGDATP